MPDVRAQLIISARDEASATMKSVASSTAAITPPTKEAGLSLMDLYAGVRLVEMGFRAVKGAYDSVITPSIELADKTRALQNSIGATAEEAGKLIYAADQADVSFATLSTGLKAAIRTLQSTKSEGIAPTIEGIGQLADKYNAIVNPIERTTFLMHNFGRSGADLATLMKLGGDEIRKLGEEAVTTGAILDQKGVTSLHDLDDATKKLNTTILGLKVSLALLASPTLTSVISAYTDTLTVQERFNAVSQAGFLTQEDQIKIWKSDLLGGILGTKEAALAALADAEARMKEAEAIKAVGNAYDYMIPKAAATAPAIESITGVWDSFTVNTYRASAAIDDSKEALKKEADALQIVEKQQNALLSGGMSGTLQSAQRSYTDSIKGTQTEIDKLTKQIAEMTAANGKEFTVVTESKVRQEDYNLAVERAALSQAKYDAALAGTIDKQGKLHQVSALTLEGMRIAAESAQNQVDKLTEKMGSSTSVTADYTSALADANAKLSDLKQKQQDAEDAVKKTTGSFILQQLALDTKLTPAMELNMARALGLIDEKSYNLAHQVQYLTGMWDLNKNGVIDAGVETEGLTRSLVGLDKEAITASTTVPKATGATVLLGGAAHHAADDVGALAGVTGHLNDNVGHIPDTIPAATIGLDRLRGHAWDAAQALNNIPNSVHVSVVTDWITNYTQNGVPPEARGGWHGAGGLDMIVPPGFPNDSFPVNVQSGEHVKVTPAGKGGDATLTALLTNLPGMIARAVRDGMQR